MKPFFGAAFLVLLLLHSTVNGQQQSVPGNFRNNVDNRPASFNNNIDPFNRRPLGSGDNVNAIFEEP